MLNLTQFFGRKNVSLQAIQAKATYDIYWYYYYYFLQLAASVFRIKNAPESIDTVFFDSMLTLRGTAALLKQQSDIDPDRIFGLPYNTYWGRRDYYGYPAGKIVGLASNTYRTQVYSRDFVIFYDNNLRITLEPYISMLALLCWEIHNTYRSNLRHQNKPFILPTSSAKMLRTANIWNDFANFSPYIAIKEKKNPTDGDKIRDRFEVLDLKVPYIGTELLDSLQEVVNLGCNWFGITTMDGKRERLVQNEALMSNMAPKISRESRFAIRQQQLEKANKKWGLNMEYEIIEPEIPILKPFAEKMEATENVDV